MQKFNGGNPVHICDGCRTTFYPEDRIYEFCKDCANTVWCVFNIYEDGSKELSSLHHSEESAVWFRSECWITAQKLNSERDNKIVDIIIEDWTII